MTLSIMAKSIMAKSIIAKSIKTLCITTLSIKSHSITTLSIKSLSTFQMFYFMVGSWPYPSTIDYAGKAYQGQTLYHITRIHKLRTKKVL